jgi:hypothetical protein
MKGFLVPVFVALIILLTCTSAACAGTGPASLSIASVKENGGYIITEAMVTPSNKTDSEAGYLSYWLDAVPGDCSASRLLGWQYLPSSPGPVTEVMKGPVPYGVTPGNYGIRVVYREGTEVPGSCDKGVSAGMNVTLTLPGKGTHDMVATLEDSGGNAPGPDYRIDAISNIDTTVRVTPSSSLAPSVTVSNVGSGDLSGQPVEVHAYLGSEEMIPVKAVIDPMKAGESRTVSLSYTVPGSISLRSYPFFMIIDPRGVHGTADAATNLKRTGGQMVVRTEEEDPLAGHGCGCK